MSRRRPSRVRRRVAGFTLIEAALTTVIIGTGVLAIVAAQQAYLRKNAFAVREAMGLQLANELRERVTGLPLADPVPRDGGTVGAEETDPRAFDDLDDFAGTTDGLYGDGLTFADWDGADYAGPINALGNVIPDLANWGQFIEVENVFPGDLDAIAGQVLGSTDVMRVTVTTLFRQDPDDEDTQEVVSTMRFFVTRDPGKG